MITLGYKLSSEEQSPLDLVRYAQMAQDSGFGFALISDHYHPWIDKQGQSPFVWGVLGAIAQATQRLTVGTAVTCPTTRLHPAVVAQAAATAAALMPGRFFLGVGTGENLNEHVVGQGWPETEVRQERLEEAIAVIRQLGRAATRATMVVISPWRMRACTRSPTCCRRSSWPPAGRAGRSRRGASAMGSSAPIRIPRS